MKKAVLALSTALFLAVGCVAAPAATIQAANQVYYTTKGKKYHSTKGCKSLARSKSIHKTTEDKAKKMKLKPCKFCYEKSGGNAMVTSAQNKYDLPFGTLMDIAAAGSTAVVKVKILPGEDKGITVGQNYYNVCDLIKNHGLSAYNEIKYVGVIDAANGKETNAVTFTVPKSIIDGIAVGLVTENQIGDSVTDLWVIPSLK